MELSWRDSTRPYSSEFDDIYYAEEDGLLESRYVFLEQNDLSNRFKNAEIFTIGELGFGTGLNFIATWDLWRKTQKMKSSILYYLSCEKFPLSRAQLLHALSRWPEIDNLAKQLADAYFDLPPGYHRIHFKEDRIVLDILRGDARNCLEKIETPIDCWYLDGFSPRKNPEMWDAAMMAEIARHSSSGTTLSTYSAAGFIKRELQNVGFTVEKFKGFGRKKEMLKARFELPKGKPRAGLSLSSSKRVAIIGAGIAGSNLAEAFAYRGWNVSIFEREKEIASRASGNSAAISLPSLTKEPTPLGRYSVAGFRYLENHRRGFQFSSEKSGLIQLPDRHDRRDRWRAALEILEIPTSLASILSPEEASDIAGIPLSSEALFLPDSSWIDLKNLATSLIHSSDLISLQANTAVKSFQKIENAWRLRTDDNQILGDFDTLVLANAYDAREVLGFETLPLRKVRGQVVSLRTNAELQQLKTNLSFDGFLTKRLPDDTHLLGATYDNEDLSSDVRSTENEELVSRLQKTSQIFKESHFEVSDSRVEFRTNVPGQLPIIGEIEENLFVSLAHSSKGAIYSPLAGDAIASAASGHPLPLEKDLYDSLSPKRF